MGQIDDLYRRVVHVKVANGESSGQFVENSEFKRKGILNLPIHYVKQINSDLNI